MRLPGYTTRIMLSFLLLAFLAVLLSVASTYRIRSALHEMHNSQTISIQKTAGSASTIDNGCEKMAVAKANRALRDSHWFSGFIIALAIAMAVYTNFTLRRPLAGLMTATQNIARGQFDYRIDITSTDEVGKLIDAFNGMSSELLRKDRQITGQLRQLQKTKSLLESNSSDLEKKNQEMEAFIYTVSHDLKAPLIAIQGFLAVLADEFGAALSPKASFYLDRVQANGEHMQTLIQQLLELSRAGRSVKHLSKVSTHTLVQQVIDDLHLQIEENNALVLLKGRWPEIVCEPIRVRQAISNLVDNALHYCQASTPIKIELSVTSRENCWRFKIKDNGIGIDPAYHSRVFDMFERLGDASERNSQGTGIGLAIVKKIAESHGGNAGVKSTPGRGSTFFFDISKKLKANS